MYVTQNKNATIVTGAIFGVDQIFPGGFKTGLGALTTGTVIQRDSILRVTINNDTAPFAPGDYTGQVSIKHLLDGAYVFQGFLPTLIGGTSSVSPFLLGIRTNLVLGNDGNLYQYNALLQAAGDDVIAANTVNGASLGLGFFQPKGPIDPASIEWVGAANEIPNFNGDISHLLQTAVQFDSDPEPDGVTVVAQLILDTMTIHQGVDGNTASQ